MVILPPIHEQRDGHWAEVEPASIAPELMTEDEAVRYLRLDRSGVKRPTETLRRYRMLGLLRGTQVGRRVLYRRVELDAFLERQTEKNPR